MVPIVAHPRFAVRTGSTHTPSRYAIDSYVPFSGLNNAVLAQFHLVSVDKLATAPVATVFESSVGVALLRFIAFAYTYHYLNWFSKTSIIKWHQVDRRKLAGALVIWLASLGLYASSYELGARWLFLLSFAHVLLEFPLNHLSFAGIGTELAARVRGARASSGPAR